MTWAWSFVFLSRRIFWSNDLLAGGLGNKMAARMTCALLGTFLGVMVIYVVDFIGDRVKCRLAFDAICEAVVLGIAIGWECAFKKAVHAVADLNTNSRERVYFSVTLSVFLCGIIIP